MRRRRPRSAGAGQAAAAPTTTPEPQRRRRRRRPGYAVAIVAAAPKSMCRRANSPPVAEGHARSDRRANPAVRCAALFRQHPGRPQRSAPIERWPGRGADPADAAGGRSRHQAYGACAACRDDAKRRAETIAPKGEVTGPGQRPKTPAERLGLDAKERAKAEKCLAEAIYFESRGETEARPDRGRAGGDEPRVLGLLPEQRLRRRLSERAPLQRLPVHLRLRQRQGRRQRPALWEQAKEISRDMLDGKLWLSDIGKSTHYHAYWVHPWWVGTMRKLSTIGVHKFYRPKRWGDGSDAPAFGPGITPENVKLSFVSGQARPGRFFRSAQPGRSAARISCRAAPGMTLTSRCPARHPGSATNASARRTRRSRRRSPRSPRYCRA